MPPSQGLGDQFYTPPFSALKPTDFVVCSTVMNREKKIKKLTAAIQAEIVSCPNEQSSAGDGDLCWNHGCPTQLNDLLMNHDVPEDLEDEEEHKN